MKTKYEIVARSSGYWAVDGSNAEGPFSSATKAARWIARKEKPVKRKAIKLRTVNVIEITNGEFQSIRSFADNPKGNKRAERLFARCIKENTPKEAPMDKEDISVCIEDGVYEDCGGYQIFLTHSI